MDQKLFDDMLALCNQIDEWIDSDMSSDFNGAPWVEDLRTIINRTQWQYTAESRTPTGLPLDSWHANNSSDTR